jgi:hypothetical protein
MDVQLEDLMIKEVEKGFGGEAIKLAEKLHERGKRIFGLISWNIPEEVIYASNIIPFRLFGEAQLVEKAHTYLPSWSCSFSRRCLETAFEPQVRLARRPRCLKARRHVHSAILLVEALSEAEVLAPSASPCSKE